MNIAIIGKGTSAIIQALTCIKYGHKITIFYDPNVPEICVGESTTPLVFDLIQDVCKLSIGDMVDDGIVSFKNGVKFINWGNVKSFRHHFFSKSPLAGHFLTKKFNKYIHDMLKFFGVEYIEYNVKEVSEDFDGVFVKDKKYDFVVHCTGWNGLSLEYRKPIIETMNSGLIFEKNDIDDYSYTIHRAHEYGWQFELPFPEQSLSRCGYLFNRNYHSVEEAKEKVNNKNAVLLEWNPRYSKKLIISDRQFLNGNCLFFLEPLQALSLHYYTIFAEFICECIKNPSKQNLINLNNKYLYEMNGYQHIIALHYSYGSSFNTSFWDDIVRKSKDIISKNPVTGDQDSYIEFFMSDIIYGLDTSRLGCFLGEDHLHVFCGMTGKSRKNLFYGNNHVTT